MPRPPRCGVDLPHASGDPRGSPPPRRRSSPACLKSARRVFLRRLRGLHRQRFHLGGHHREALARLAGARRLDGGVERQQVGLPAHVRISLTTSPIFCAACARPADLARWWSALRSRRPRTSSVVWSSWRADLGDRARQLVGGGGRRLHVARRFVGGRTAPSARCDVWSRRAGERGGGAAHGAGTVRRRSGAPLRRARGTCAIAVSIAMARCSCSASDACFCLWRRAAR